MALVTNTPKEEKQALLFGEYIQSDKHTVGQRPALLGQPPPSSRTARLLLLFYD